MNILLDIGVGVKIGRETGQDAEKGGKATAKRDERLCSKELRRGRFAGPESCASHG